MISCTLQCFFAIYMIYCTPTTGHGIWPSAFNVFMLNVHFLGEM